MSKKKGNVLINQRTGVHAGSGGILTTVDVCLTKIGPATVPISYTNVAKSEDAANTASTVFINGHPACNKESIFSKSTGDEPGDKKGMRSGTIQGKAEFITGSPNVFIEGLPAVREGDMMVSNNGNTAPMPLSQPGAPPARSLEALQAEELKASKLTRKLPVKISGDQLNVQNEFFGNADVSGSPDDSPGFDSLKPVSDSGRPDGTNGFRDITLEAGEKDEEQDLYLKFLDDDFEHNFLYLGRSKTFEKDETVPENYNNMVPLMFRCYATPDRDPAKAFNPPRGWIYIIRRFDHPDEDSRVELFRELESNGMGSYSDVNLKELEGLDQRKASGQWCIRAIVPYRVDQKDHEIWVAYSEVQWSRARIESMKKDGKLRDRRMHKIDLSGCLENFQNSHYQGPATDEDLNESTEVESATGPARLYNQNTAPDRLSKGAQKLLKDDIPVVYLDNPVGIARRLGLVYQDRCQVMIEYVKMLSSAPGLLQMETVGSAKKSDGEEDSKDDPRERQQILQVLDATAYDPIRWFDSAQILNQFLYAKLPDTAPEELTAKEQEDFLEQLEKAKKKRKKYLEKINEEDLKKALRTRARRDIREQILVARFHLVKFLESELAERGEDSALLNALDDYFTLSARIQDEKALRLKKIEGFDVYADAWKTFSEIIQYLDKHEYTFDCELEPLATDGWTLRKNDDGIKLLIKIADPQKNLPIHSRLFPKMVAAGKPLQIDDTKVEDGDPVFKTDYFDNLKDVELDRALQSIMDFPSRFGEVIAMDDRDDGDYKKSIGRIRQSLSRLNNGVLKCEFEEVMVSADDILAYKEGVEDDSDVEIDTKLSRKAVLAFGKGGRGFFKYANQKMDARMNSKTDTDIKIDSEGRGIRSFGTPPDSEYRFSNTRIDKIKGTGGATKPTVTSSTGDEVELVLKRTGRSVRKFGNIRYRFRAVMIMKDEARRRLAGLIQKNSARIEAISKMVSIVETINMVVAFQKVMNNRNDDKRERLAAELIMSFCKTVVAVGEVAKVAPEGEGLAMAGAGLGPKIGGVEVEKGIADIGKELPYLKAIAQIGNLIQIHLTWQSMVENYRQNDDAYIAGAIMVSGLVITTFSGGIAVLLGFSTGWVTGVGYAVVLAGILAAMFLFPEDEHIEMWLANGPFASGESLCWNNGRYLEFKKTVTIRDSNGRHTAKECTIHNYWGFDQDDAFCLAIDEDGNLADSFNVSSIPGRNKLKKENNRVYLKAGEHPLAEEDTLIGIIGKPYTPLLIMQPQIGARFMGHTPGADPMIHVPASKPGLFFKSTPNPDEYPEYRCAMWCEYPDEAYAALMDALYRPQAALEQTPLAFPMLKSPTNIILKVSVPYFIKGKSRLDINIEIKDHDRILEAYTPDQDTIESCEVESGQYEFVFKIPQGDSDDFTLKPLLTYTAKIRLDLLGDGKVQLPHEALFCDTDIENKSDKKTVEGVQLPADSKWIVVETKFHCNYSKYLMA